MTSTRTRLVAATGALAITMLAAAPAGAATVLSRADANAATISLAGNGQGTGTASATYDGETETRTGQTTPAAPFPQQFVDLGVLTQQATAGDGFSAACAGVAGTGGGIVQIGDGSCLTPGDTVTGSLSDVSLAGLGLEAPTGLPAQLPAELQTLLGQLPGGADQLDAIITTAVDAVDDQVGPLGLSLRFDAIEGRCRVEGSTPTGSASIANAGLVLSGGGQEIQVVDLPANPAPNTEVTTDLSKVADTLLGAVTTQLQSGLAGATGPLATAIAPFRDQIVAGVRANLDGQLAPLRDNVLSVVLNEQSNPTSDSIKVTALHASVLPAAASAVGASLADVRIGNADCGPAGSAPVVQAPQAAPPKDLPAIPTAVSAGMESAPQTQQVTWTSMAPLGVTALVGLVVAGLGLAGLRRHLS